VTIHNAHGYLKGVWDWSILDGCYTGNCGITDIDGLTERKGRFLVLETKAPGVPLPLGQHYTFEAMRRLGAFTVLVVWGETDRPQEIQFYTKHGVTDVLPCTLAALRAVVSEWFEQVNTGKPVSLKDAYKRGMKDDAR
jgi:hypothetical protein